MSQDTTTASVSQDTLIAGSFRRVEVGGTVLAGQDLPRGAVLGKITTGGKLQLLDKDATDGSQVPFGILAEATDTSATGTNADTVAPVYLTGEFDSSALALASGTTVADVWDALRAKSIFAKTVASN